MNKMLSTISNNWILKCSFCTVHSVQNMNVSLHSCLQLTPIYLIICETLSFTLNVLTLHFCITILYSTFISHFVYHSHLPLMLHTLKSLSLHSLFNTFNRVIAACSMSPYLSICSSLSGSRFCSSQCNYIVAVASVAVVATEATNCVCSRRRLTSPTSHEIK